MTTTTITGKRKSTESIEDNRYSCFNTITLADGLFGLRCKVCFIDVGQQGCIEKRLKQKKDQHLKCNKHVVNAKRLRIDVATGGEQDLVVDASDGRVDDDEQIAIQNLVQEYELETIDQGENIRISVDSAFGENEDSDEHLSAMVIAPTRQTLDPLWTALAVGTFCFHAFMHNQSNRANTCFAEQTRTLYDNRFHLGRTKSAAILKGVFGPLGELSVKQELKSVKSICIMHDITTHHSKNLIAILARFFSPTLGVQYRVLQFQKVKSEDAVNLTNVIVATLEKFEINKQQVTMLGGDNTNTNYGGKDHKGQNNIYYYLQKHLGHPLYTSCCAAHIVNNACDNAVTALSPHFQLETYVAMAYRYFHSQPKRCDEFRELCKSEFAIGVETKRTDQSYIPLPFSKVRWYSLILSISRLLEFWEPLDVYFRGQGGAANAALLREFFHSNSNLAWLRIIYHVGLLYFQAIKDLEGDMNCVASAIRVVDKLRADTYNDFFVPCKIVAPVQTVINQWKAVERSRFVDRVKGLYQDMYSYIDEWTNYLYQFKCFDWILLEQPIDTLQAIRSVSMFSKYSPHISLDQIKLARQLNFLNRILPAKIVEWSDQKLHTSDKWRQMFDLVRVKYQANISELQLLVEFAMTASPSNAPTERFFAKMKLYWTFEKSRLMVCTVKYVIGIRYNLFNTCTAMRLFLFERPEILRKIQANEKYTFPGYEKDGDDDSNVDLDTESRILASNNFASAWQAEIEDEYDRMIMRGVIHIPRVTY